MPQQTTWYSRFARNRIVLAYSDKSLHADSIGGRNWYEILQLPDVQTGRSDPDQDPAGYRAILVMRLAELHYGVPGLSARLLAAAPDRNMRPNEADLIALLQSGELDYAWEYESLARGAERPYVALPHAIDLGSAGDSAFYARASVRVRGATSGDTLLIRGEPIIYGLSIPIGAPHQRLAAQFVEFMFSEKGRAAMMAENLDLLDQPVIVGTGAPTSVMTKSPIAP
jgi:molybdate/tungstate transport system substrate-binding protein